MKKLAIFLGIFLFLSASSVWAAPFTPSVANDVYGVAQGGTINAIPTANDTNDSGPDIYSAINTVLGTNTYVHNYQVDSRFVQPDYVWQNLLSPAPVALVGLSAAYSNTLGFYTGLGTGTGQTQLIAPVTGFSLTGNGTSASPFNGIVTESFPSAPFGFFLESVGGGATRTYFSESSLNASGLDHMMTFYLPELAGRTIYISDGSTTWAVEFTVNSYLLAWEDLPLAGGALGDEDYDDMMYLVAKVAPVPEPTTLLLLGLGLIGMAGVRRYKK
jgi:hypothetical protein